MKMQQNYLQCTVGPHYEIGFPGQKKLFSSLTLGQFLRCLRTNLGQRNHPYVHISSLKYPVKHMEGKKIRWFFLKKHYLLFGSLLTPGTIFFRHLGVIWKLWHVAIWQKWRKLIFKWYGVLWRTISPENHWKMGKIQL